MPGCEGQRRGEPVDLLPGRERIPLLPACRAAGVGDFGEGPVARDPCGYPALEFGVEARVVFGLGDPHADHGVIGRDGAWLDVDAPALARAIGGENGIGERLARGEACLLRFHVDHGFGGGDAGVGPCGAAGEGLLQVFDGGHVGVVIDLHERGAERDEPEALTLDVRGHAETGGHERRSGLRRKDWPGRERCHGEGEAGAGLSSVHSGVPPLVAEAAWLGGLLTAIRRLASGGCPFATKTRRTDVAATTSACT